MAQKVFAIWFQRSAIWYLVKWKCTIQITSSTSHTHTCAHLQDAISILLLTDCPIKSKCVHFIWFDQFPWHFLFCFFHAHTVELVRMLGVHPCYLMKSTWFFYNCFICIIKIRNELMQIEALHANWFIHKFYWVISVALQ